jgi:hypothetical protein
VWCPTFEVEEGVTLISYMKVCISGISEAASVRPTEVGPQTELYRLYPGAQLDKGMEIAFEKIVVYIRLAEDEASI